jgi:hypothetical protein
MTELSIGPRRPLQLALVGLIGLAVGVAAMLVVRSTTRSDDQVVDRFSGTLVKYSTSRQGICVQVVGEKTTRCGQPYLQPSQGDLHEGDQVTILVTRMHQRSGNPEEMYVVVRTPLPS